MAAIRDNICDLIEPAAVPTRQPGLHGTPHAEALGNRCTDAVFAAHRLIEFGCLVRQIRITADTVVIELHRRPSIIAIGAQVGTAARPGETPVQRYTWRDVIIEWPAEEVSR